MRSKIWKKHIDSLSTNELVKKCDEYGLESTFTNLALTEKYTPLNENNLADYSLRTWMVKMENNLRKMICYDKKTNSFLVFKQGKCSGEFRL